MSLTKVTRVVIILAMQWMFYRLFKLNACQKQTRQVIKIPRHVLSEKLSEFRPETNSICKLRLGLLGIESYTLKTKRTYLENIGNIALDDTEKTSHNS